MVTIIEISGDFNTELALLSTTNLVANAGYVSAKQRRRRCNSPAIAI
jgi:hypothetical protein